MRDKGKGRTMGGTINTGLLKLNRNQLLQKLPKIKKMPIGEGFKCH